MSDSTKLRLHFLGSEHPELCKVFFSHPRFDSPHVLIRGGSSVAHLSQRTFLWSPAVKALCLLILRALAKAEVGDTDNLNIFPCGALIGRRRSPASSLDYAMDKQPVWLVDFFGADSNGKCIADRFIRRSNRCGKLPGPIVLILNEAMVPLSAIEIRINERAVETREELLELIHTLQVGWLPRHEAPTRPPCEAAGKFPPQPVTNCDGGADIGPATEDEVRQIHEYEKAQFPGDHATHERLLEWLRHDPNNFACMRYPGEAPLGYYILHFLKQPALHAFRGGYLLEDDVSEEHLLPASNKDYLSATHAHIVVVASQAHFSFLAAELFWHLIGRLLQFANDGELRFVSAEVANPGGLRMIERFGFRPAAVTSTRPGDKLYELELSPKLLEEWNTRRKLKTFTRVPSFQNESTHRQERAELPLETCS